MTAFDTFSEIPLFKYNLIMSDPPWQFELRSSKGEEKSAQNQYDCMTIDEIRAMPVDTIANKDCILWLWATNPMMPQALMTLEAWGFDYVTMGSWAKKTVNNKYRWGTGYVLRSTNEPFLIGRMGSPQVKPIQSGFDGVAREHSRKPEESYRLAEKFVPNAWRLDMFSRESREGWDSFGDEAEKFDEVK